MRLDHLLSREFLFHAGQFVGLCIVWFWLGALLGSVSSAFLFGGWGGVFGFWIVDASIFVVVVGICDIGGKL